MVKTRVHDLAAEFGVPPEQLLGMLKDMNIFVRSHLSALENDQVSAIRVRWEREKRKSAEEPTAKKGRRKAVKADSKTVAVQARIGVVKSALRLGEFLEAQKEAAVLKLQEPRSADVMAVHADALWSAGLFDEAHEEFKDALSMVPDLSRGRHGLARALASQNKLEEALNEAQAALKSSPRDEEIHHTVGAIFERMRRY